MIPVTVSLVSMSFVVPMPGCPSQQCQSSGLRTAGGKTGNAYKGSIVRLGVGYMKLELRKDNLLITFARNDLPASLPSFSGLSGKVSVVTESGTKLMLIQASLSVLTEMRLMGQSSVWRQFLSVQLIWMGALVPSLMVNRSLTSPVASVSRVPQLAVSTDLALAGS